MLETQGMLEIVVPSIIGSLAGEGRYGNLQLEGFNAHLWDLFRNIKPLLVKYLEHLRIPNCSFSDGHLWTTSALC